MEAKRQLRRERHLLPYDAPSWARSLKFVPRWRVNLLSARPTKLERLWDASGVPDGFELSVKRDDLTGAALSGNKSRKLEFILAHAIENAADAVITCGAVQSNHARVTAAAARQVGLRPYAFLRSKTPDREPDGADAGGNMALHKLLGTTVFIVPPEKYETGLKPRMQGLADDLKAQDGTSAYLIPVGGSDVIGVWGYLDAWDELMKIDTISDSFDDLVLATGSGGTAAGLAIGNWLTGSRIRIHAISVCDNAEYFYEHVDFMLRELGLDSEVSARDILHVIDGYKGRGYGLATDSELSDLVQLASSTGLILDPVYTNKAFNGMVAEMRQRPGQFAGHRCLFLHTGGVFGALGHPSLSARPHDTPLTTFSPREPL